MVRTVPLKKTKPPTVFAAQLSPTASLILLCRKYEFDREQPDLACLENARNSGGIISPLRGHRGNYDRGDETVQFVRRNDQTGATLLDLASNGRVQIHQVDFKPFHFHSHSSLSQEVWLAASASNNLSSPLFDMDRNFCAQPWRGFFTERMIIWRSRTSSSTSPLRWVCSNTTLGIRMPWEFPIRTMLAFIDNHLQATSR